MKKTILIPGIIGGFIVATLMISATVYGYNSGRFESSMLLGYASMILAFSLIFVAIKNLRDKHYNGTISFGKAFVRNIIKWLISAFTGFGNGILPILYIIAQIIAYSYSKKFFHDQLSNTVIGERLPQTA